MVAGIEKCKPWHDGEYLDKQIYCMKGHRVKGMTIDCISHKQPNAIIVSRTRKCYCLEVNRSNLKCSYFHFVLVRLIHVLKLFSPLHCLWSLSLIGLDWNRGKPLIKMINSINNSKGDRKGSLLFLMGWTPFLAGWMNRS